jgi:hypothetical protein
MLIVDPTELSKNNILKTLAFMKKKQKRKVTKQYFCTVVFSLARGITVMKLTGPAMLPREPVCP